MTSALSSEIDNSQTVDLSRVRVVLVNTSHPGNIGAVARAMKNMGLQQLLLVQPAEFPSAEATARASGADDILATAQIVGSLEEAIADCALVVGASARLRTISWPTLDPKACAERMIDVAASDQVALVMGRERTGLTNAELEHCHYLVHIPANPDYTSLNVAAATQVLVYELRMAALAKDNALDYRWRSDHPFATNEELEGLYAHFEAALTQLGFLDPDNPRQLMRRLRRLFNRSQLDRMEVNILRGILATAEKGGKGKPRG
jgi:TrmH family RNA methyltransferase